MPPLFPILECAKGRYIYKYIVSFANNQVNEQNNSQILFLEPFAPLQSAAVTRSCAEVINSFQNFTKLRSAGSILLIGKQHSPPRKSISRFIPSGRAQAITARLVIALSSRQVRPAAFVANPRRNEVFYENQQISALSVRAHSPQNENYESQQ